MKYNPEDEAGMARAFDEMEALAQAGTDPQSVTDPDMAANLELLAVLAADHHDDAMPHAVEFRKSVMKRIRHKRKLYRETVLSLAAVFLIGAFMFVFKHDKVNQPAVMMDEALLDTAMDNQTREAMVNYLESSEQLLLSIRDHEVSCSEDQADIQQEKALAKELLLRQKLFAPQMNDPEYYQAKHLLSQLERILVDVNAMDPCTDPFEMEMINDHINTNRILSKLRLVAQEIQLS